MAGDGQLRHQYGVRVLSSVSISLDQYQWRQLMALFSQYSKMA
jgi:hypothetical protein